MQRVIYSKALSLMLVYMQFFRMRDDESKNWRNILITQLPKEEFSAIQSRFGSQTPKLTCSAMIRGGIPYVVFEYGGTISLSETFGSGQTLGDKLFVGDVVTVILTDQPQEQLLVSSEGALKLNFNLKDVIVYAFTYTKEMEQIYDFYTHYIKIKEGNREIELKKKPKHLSLR
jgi:hypothetical protein